MRVLRKGPGAASAFLVHVDGEVDVEHEVPRLKRTKVIAFIVFLILRVILVIVVMLYVL